MRIKTNKRLAQMFPWSNTEFFPATCGEGWAKILEEGFSRIEKEVGKEYISENFFVIIKISSERGHIVISCVNGNEQTDAIIADMVKKSKTTCELCGEPAEPDDNLVFCSKCRKF